ncbi:MAG: hypothetical protein LBS01_04940 [Prevotellaceae bacterium]|jgi:hypothetical protein|nr:hypothetical protein [Prevotellaceae bacterium]
MKATIYTEIKSSNGTIPPDGRTNSIDFRNMSDGTVTILDNIVLQPGEQFAWQNHPGVVIDSPIPFYFNTQNTVNKLLVIKNYLK